MWGEFAEKNIRQICDDHGLWLIEDNCDAFGSKHHNKLTGTFGHLSTLSFYPAHHITTAEGGAVLTDDPLLYKISRSIRDWGRDCWCPTGKDNTCGKRFSWKLGNLPYGYDHKYIYSEIGYNLKITDIQAAIGVAQMNKVKHFISIRKENFKYLYDLMRQFEDHFLLPKPTRNSEPSWFGFPITIIDNKIKRRDLLLYLNKKGVSTRLLFGGNIIKQPYFINYNIKYMQVGELSNTDNVMNNTFWIGIYPGLSKEHLDYTKNVFSEFFSNL